VPGGHSPPYFAMLNQPLPTSPFTWNNDPVAFQNYPSFFIAHEIAHQWWGQAVGWKNYHEQWISEGFAQYFAALYAEKERGPDGFTPLARQMRKWAIDTSPQGPVYLGYRLGHIKSDGRVFRAILYNKSAMVLHMLRRLVGDEAFFAGVRKFYMDWRFKKAGTDDFRMAMESVSAQDLKPFFESWIYGLAIPRLRFSYDATGEEVTLKLEHRGAVAPIPVTVTLNYVSGESDSVVVPVLGQSATKKVHLRGPLRDAQVNQDYAALAEFDR
jgi:aminopeptidase N